jgi:2-oxoglutarate ferredoxin oxidoreductase subunit beta
MVDPKDYKDTQEPAWCPGCGNFGILNALPKALAELGIAPHELLIVSGIGQSGKTPHYLRCNTFNGLHGRTLPVATAAKLANHALHVIAVAGDGDCYGEGGNHFLHAMRRNINITLLVHDNQIYGLTKGQASPTTAEGTHSKTQPFGVPSEPLNPLALTVALDAGFAARGTVTDPRQLKELMKSAITHKGFALLDILQPCVTFNRINTYSWYRKRVSPLPDDYDPTDRIRAFETALKFDNEIPTGIIYKNNRPPMEDHIPVIKGTPLAKQEFSLRKGKEILGSIKP